MGGRQVGASGVGELDHARRPVGQLPDALRELRGIAPLEGEGELVRRDELGQPRVRREHRTSCRERLERRVTEVAIDAGVDQRVGARDRGATSWGGIVSWIVTTDVSAMSRISPLSARR